MPTASRRATAITLLTAGCLRAAPHAQVANAVTYPSFAGECSLRSSGEHLGIPGARLIASEEAFRASFECFDRAGGRVESRSGLDFTRDVIVVFGATGEGNLPRLTRLERDGDRLTAIFSVESYCGGAPPDAATAVHSFVVPAAPLTLERKVVVTDGEPCPGDLP